MKLKQSFSACIISFVLSLISCSNPKHSPNTKDTVNVSKSTKHNIIDSLSGAHVYSKKDSACVIVHNKTLCIPKDYHIDLTKTFPGICQIKNDSIRKSSWLILGNLVFIAINEDTGRGYTDLYVIDTKTKTLVKDKEFKRDYLSGFGIFIINGNKIFIMNKIFFDNETNIRASGSLFSINNDRFSYIKSRVEKNEIGYDDISIVNFYRKPLNKKLSTSSH
jgi:hypothetical protein